MIIFYPINFRNSHQWLYAGKIKQFPKWCKTLADDEKKFSGGYNHPLIWRAALIIMAFILIYFPQRGFSQCSCNETVISNTMPAKNNFKNTLCITNNNPTAAFTYDKNFDINGGTLCVGANVNFSSSMSGSNWNNNYTINNYGNYTSSIKLGTGQTFNNYGTFSGDVILNGGTFINHSGAVFTTTNFIYNSANSIFTNNSGGTANFNLDLLIDGKFTNDGILTLKNLSLNGSAIANIGGNTTINGSVRNDGTIKIAGQISVSGDYLQNSSGKLASQPGPQCNILNVVKTIGGAGVYDGTNGLILNKAPSCTTCLTNGVSTSAPASPTNQITSTVLSSDAVNISGTIANPGGNATHYIVLRRYKAAVTEQPVDYVSYTVGNVIGNSTVVAVNAIGILGFSETDIISSLGCGDYYYAVFPYYSFSTYCPIYNRTLNTANQHLITIDNYGVWSGKISTDWNSATNWLCGALPGITTNIKIPGTGISNWPVLDKGVGVVNNITIEKGGILTVSGTGKMQIAGTIKNTGTFDVSNGTIELNGAAAKAQIIPNKAFFNDTLLNLIISNGTTLAGPLNIMGTLSFGGNDNTFITKDNLTLKSTALGTARIADITNGGASRDNAISGKVTIERYIPAHRAWRLLSAPLSALEAPTIKKSWQEDSNTDIPKTPVNPNKTFGFPITGGSIDNGFDQAASNINPTIKYYNGATNKLIGIPTTKMPITDYSGYFVFVRGNRVSDLSKQYGDVATPAVLRMMGNVNTGLKPVTIGTTGFTLVGNPYPSGIDFHLLAKNNPSIKDKIYLWDPNAAGSYGVGAYVTLIWGGSSYNSAPIPISGYIQSGQAFFVEASGNNDPTLNFNEAYKTASGSDQVFRPVTGNEQQRVNLLALNADGTEYIADGVLTTYADINLNIVDRDDAIKWSNSGENVGIARDGQNLVIERRHTIDGADTTFLNITNLWQPKYTLQVTTDAMENSGLYAVLKDNYSPTINNTPLNLGGVTDIIFNVNADPASYAANRFSIVFGKQAMVLPVTFVSVTASPRQRDIVVHWLTADELNIKGYTVETSLTGSNFTKLATVAATANNASGASYTWVDANAAAGLHYYRIKSTEMSGKENYSIIVKAGMGNAVGGMAVSPNPVTGNSIHLQLKNMAAGKYQARLVATNGQVLLSKEISHAGGDAVENIPLTKYITKGMYGLEITGSDDSKVVISVAVE